MAGVRPSGAANHRGIWEYRGFDSKSQIDVRAMGSLKKRRKAKINRHKRRKKLRLHRHKKRTWQK